MAISRIGGGSQPIKRVTVPVAEDTYGAEIVALEEVTQKDTFGEDPDRDVQKLKITFAITDGDHKDVPLYSFQQPSEEELANGADYNFYGKRITVWLTPSLSNGGKGQQSTLHKLWVAANKGRKDSTGASLDGKPMTEEEINRIAKNPDLILELIGKRVRITVGINKNGKNNVTNYMAANAKTKAFVQPNYRLTPEQLADVSTLKYADTGETVTGYHRMKQDGSWEYVSAQAASDASINNYGDIYSPKEQARRRDAGQRRQNTGNNNNAAVAVDTDDIPF